MKRRFLGRKLAALGLCAVLCVPANLQAVHAEEAADSPVYTGYVDQDLKPADSIHEEGAPEVLWEAAPLPTKYEPETSQLPAVRNQGEYGTCWAFSSLACIEIYLMKHPEVTPNLTEEERNQIDLSELHTAYFANFSAVDPLGGTTGDSYRYTASSPNFLKIGGSYDMAENVLSDWMGAVNESVVPYDKAPEVLTGGLSNTLAYGSDAYHLQGYRRINMKDRDDIKRAIQEYGAVGISYYSDQTSYGSSTYYNATTYGYYCNNSGYGSNHGVTIVGWDDTYSKDNFNSGVRPSNDGAWLVRNSWGSSWGKAGYFYLSYEDKTIGSNGVVFIPESADNYTHNYQYDGAVWKQFVFLPKSANVFTATEAGGEKLEAVSFDTYSVNQTYTIQIYKNPTDSVDPETGVLAATLTGTTNYEGMYTVKLDQPVYLAQGEKFAVVVSLVGTGGYGSIVADANASDAGYVCTNSGGTGKSLAYYGYWYDFGEYKNSNFHIKAYTNDLTSAEKVAVSGVTISAQQLTLQKGDTTTLTATVIPANATNPSVIWSSSDPSVATVDSNGVVTAVVAGEATITATTADGGFYAGCRVTVEVPLQQIALNQSALNLTVGAESQLQVSYTPEDTTVNKTVNWSSSNPSVAMVDGNGKVKAIAAGQAVITAKVGECTANVTVSVKEEAKPVDPKPESKPESKPQTGWVNNGGTWYYRNADGSKATGWVNDGGTWYYMNGSGAMTTGWVNDGGTWYYMNGSGAMATGWVNDGGTWYYMNGSGAMATGWVNDGGTWYYMNGSGAMATGWVHSGGKWYYMKSSGAMATGWLYTGGHWYYLYSDGSMAANTKIGRYRIRANGIWK